MDADTRQELKKNELADALTKLGGMEAKKWLQIAAIVVVIALVVIGVRAWSGAKQAARDRAWGDLVLADADAKEADEVLNRLRGLLDRHDEPAFQAAVRLRLGAALAHQAQKDPGKHDALMREAVGVLSAIPPRVAPGFQAAADFLLAQVHESLLEFDKARELYQRLVANDAYAGYPQRELAQGALASLDQLKSNPVQFTPGDKPAPVPATQAAVPGQRLSDLLPPQPAAAPAETPAAPTEQPTQPESPAAAPGAEPAPAQPAAPAAPSGDAAPATPPAATNPATP